MQRRDPNSVHGLDDSLQTSTTMLKAETPPSSVPKGDFCEEDKWKGGRRRSRKRSRAVTGWERLNDRRSKAAKGDSELNLGEVKAMILMWKEWSFSNPWHSDIPKTQHQQHSDRTSATTATYKNINEFHEPLCAACIPFRHLKRLSGFVLMTACFRTIL